MAVEIPKFEQRYAEIKEGDILHRIPVRNLGSKVALRIGAIYKDITDIQKKTGDLDDASPEKFEAANELFSKFEELFRICIIDFDKHEELFDRIPLDPQVYISVFDEITTAMAGGSDIGSGVKKKKIRSSPQRGSSSSSEEQDSQETRSENSTDSPGSG